MAKSTKVAPPNSLILIEDLGGGEVPASMGGSLVVSTDSCIAVGCRSDVDGDTQFTLGETHDVDPGGHPIFRGLLKTPNRRVALVSVIGQVILEAAVLQQQTIVRVWVNHPSEPDHVIVGIG
jgi:hypothetical protein